MNTSERLTPYVVLSDVGVEVTRLTARWTGWKFVVTADSVTVVPPARHRITVAEWRAIPLGRIRGLAEPLLVGDLASTVVGIMGDADGARPGTRSHLLAVIATYRAALEQGLPPREAVAEHLRREDGSKTPYGTVNRWLSEARKLTPRAGESDKGYRGLPFGLEDEERAAWAIELPQPATREESK